ncbi:ral GTPase-activating protein subunit beta [Hyalella azteca]|uniref:Ral GTPase-activating protein subunit beta n=1 Tax=Hyalella azteca TaxID=294128 RepID=A0A979FLK5_HYAAZ|nr:ral GTPase-activating protein subunit beta [Hyalella azteca]
MMYSEWSSDIMPQQGWLGDEAAISAFKTVLPWKVSRDFVAGTAKHLAGGLSGLSKPGSAATTNLHPSAITHDKQLNIIMPALGYGLSFPLSELDVLRDCVSVYCDWLTAFLPNPKACVPQPIIDDPNHYAAIIISHFYYVFVPRGGEGAEVNKQAVLCHRVLRMLQTVAQSSTSMSEETWHTLLLFLLHINSALLAPPSTKARDDAGEQLCERVLSVLFETWLLACDKCFPPPPLWTALRQGCTEWRHRRGLVQQWGRVCSALTAKLLLFMYGPHYTHRLAGGDELNVIPATMTNDCVAQVWFRLLHVLGNPVELSKHQVISKTPAFLKFAISSEAVVEPCQHPCLNALPQIFLAAIKVIASLADAFIGGEEDGSRGAVAGKAKVNSVLHLFGPWLFEAALIGTDLSPSPAPHTKSETASSVSGVLSAGGPTSTAGAGGRRPTSVYSLGGDHRKSVVETSTFHTAAPGERLAVLTPADFEAGRAEALAALCRIVSSVTTGEEVLPVYLSRFFIAVREGLRSPLPPPHKRPPTANKAVPCSESAAAILLHGCDLFRVDLEGAITLVPALLPVLTAVLVDRTARPDKKHSEAGSSTTSSSISSEAGNDQYLALRRAATNMLLSILPLPLHFQELTIKEVGVAGERHKLSQFRPQLLNLLSTALQSETQPSTIHTLLGGLMFCVQDASLWEAMDSVSQHNYSLSEGRDTHTPLGGESVSSLCGVTVGELSIPTEDASGRSESSSLPPSGPPSSTLLPPVSQLVVSPSDCGSTLVLRSIYLVCHNLILSWRTDVNVSLAGLELLAGLARLHPPHQDWLESKRAVKWLCDYIVYQCSRPPPAHSKDLHSTIVAAFQTCSVWLLSHPSLLLDQDCLATLLEVIELGISGAKSQNKGQVILKHEKTLKPASLRVRDAAEALLSCVLSQVGRLPASCGVELVSSQLDECTLLQHCNVSTLHDPVTLLTATQHFRYYVSQNSTLLALLEQPLGNHQDPQPSVTAIIRGPFGRSVWSLQLRHLPRHRSALSHHTNNPGRPLPLNECGVRHNVRPQFFPDSVDRIPQCKADKSIPSLESVIHATEKSSDDHDKLLQILEHQIAFEEQLEKKAAARESEGEEECSAPPVCQEFQTARLLLTHLGLLSVDSLQCVGEGTVPDLVELDSTQTGFVKDLEALDATNNRSVDTVHVFYVAAGQTSPHQILGNVVSASSVSSHFLELLGGLGWPVSVASHAGWSGRSKAVQHLYSQQHSLLVPAPHITAPVSASDGVSLEGDSASAGSDSLGAAAGDGDATSSFSSHTSQLSSRRFGRQHTAAAGHDHKVLVVWLENYSDWTNFPTTALLPECATGLEYPGWRDRDPPLVSLIFLHPLENGLFRVKLQSFGNKLMVAGPLVSGQVVSRRVLGSLVRQTALNMARRRRLDCDSHQPPHVRRKLRIQEMVQKYRFDMTEPEFYSHLFTSPLC